ncbi:Ribbon-helix-helix protein, copG family [Aciduliprofundum sp. MAR08-339]|uniref:CopG family transcriptional regulator n=1 Tax=Aciduliprofundum sp. (strain MAR08-339) TaxID=673860 RepID=UPI0002A49398|nr:Ribbon-helix-helix protein, copG family [Aciduliprofundum sp. MAR08-339]
MSSRITSLRIDERDYELIEQAATALGIKASDFIRMAIRKELANYGLISGMEAKILGGNLKRQI